MKHHLAILIVAVLAVLAYGQSQQAPPGNPIGPRQGPQGMIDPRDFVYLKNPGGSNPLVLGRGTLPYTVPDGRILVIKQVVAAESSSVAQVMVDGQLTWEAAPFAPSASPGIAVIAGQIVEMSSSGKVLLGYLVDA